MRWRARFNCDFSILTGIENGIWVLDFDGPEGAADLVRLTWELGPLPITVKVISGRASGGFHLWFCANPNFEDLRTTSKVLGSAIDVRGWHGQIVIPGSIHKSGNRYRFAEGCAPDEVAIAALPDAWYAALPKRQDHANRLAVPRPRTAPQYMPIANGRGTLIGDGPGRGGFHRAIYASAVQFICDAGTDIDAQLLAGILQAQVLNAPVDPNRNPAETHVQAVRSTERPSGKAPSLTCCST